MAPNKFYRIARITKPVGKGATGSVFVDLSAIAKTNQIVPYCVPNEYIAAKLGDFIGLPVPPAGLIAQSSTSEIWFCSLDFNFTGNSLPPIDDEKCIKLLPRESTGVILFDVLIGNPDRHRENISLDDSSQPARLSLFDHSHALLGDTAGEATARLVSIKSTLGISGHCLLGKIQTGDYLQYWVNKITEIPDFFIDDICKEVEGLGANSKELDEVKTFLKNRRDNFIQLLNHHQIEFSGIKQWPILKNQ